MFESEHALLHVTVLLLRTPVVTLWCLWAAAGGLGPMCLIGLFMACSTDELAVTYCCTTTMGRCGRRLLQLYVYGRRYHVNSTCPCCIDIYSILHAKFVELDTERR